MKHVLAITALIGLSLAGLAPVGAQERAGVPAAYQSALKSTDRQLTSIEALFTGLEAGKTDADRDKLAGELEKQLETYADAMLRNYGDGVKPLELAVSSEGKSGSAAPLKVFEDLAQRHERRMKILDMRGQKLSAKQGLLDHLEQLDFSAPGQLAMRALDALGDFVVSPAEAAIALGIYAPCHPSQVTPQTQAACAKAISAGPGLISQATAQKNSCWNAAASRKPWLRAIIRAACVTVFVARLA